MARGHSPASQKFRRAPAKNPRTTAAREQFGRVWGSVGADYKRARLARENQ